jgi:enterochelin esterase-like enzyme
VRERKTPVIERDPANKDSILVTFVVRAPAGYRYPVPSVHGTYGWHDLYRLENVPATDIWMKTIRFPSATRTAYWLASPRGRIADPEAIDVFGVFSDPATPAQEVYTDPLSRHTAPYFNTATGEVSRYSWFEGPDAPPERFLVPKPVAPRGAVVTRVVKSALLGNARDVSIYTPPGYKSDGARDHPLLLIFDRDEYLATVQVPSMLDAMIEAQAVPPLVAVFVDSIGYEERGRELPGDPTFQQFIREELLPPLEREFGLTDDPARRIVAGCSYGGLGATLIARRYPDSFGAVLSQSGAFSRVPASALPKGVGKPEDYGEVSRLFAEGPRLPIRFAIDVGLLERDGMIQSNRHMRDVLLAKGYGVDYAEFTGAHDWIGWRGSFPTRLIALVGAARRSQATP